ncbi:MAG: hypothetical protein DRP83_05105 [Planctomycetota bacterium]|nr:MAG: hypothetical protein DRP83_05105 [Planctomycetota bacterium]
MTRHRRNFCLGLVAAMFACLGGVAMAGEGRSGALQMKLDKPVTLTLRDEPIIKVFDKLSRSAGVDFEISAATLKFLPYGRATRLNVSIPGVTLRLALSQMLSPQGLTWLVDGGRIAIVPSEPLYRMCRRATYDEMTLLGKLLTRPVESIDELASVVGTLRQATGEKKLKVVFPAFMNKADFAASFKQASAALPCPAADWLGLLLRPIGLTWYLDGDTIVVLSHKAQVKRQLGQVVSLRYQNTRVANVLLDLARKGRVQLNMSPGVMQALPRRVRKNFTLIMADASIAQALEVISGATGLEFPVTDNGFLVKTSLYLEVGAEAAAQKPAQKTAKRRGPRYIIKTVLHKTDGQSVDMYIMPDDLPPALQKALQADRAKVIRNLSKHYGLDKK